MPSTQTEAAARRLAAIVNSSDDAIISKDLNGIVESWNASAERIFGYPAAEMVGQSILKIIPPERRGEETEVLSRIRRGEMVDHFETWRRRKGGTLIPISLTVSPVRDDDGTIIGASKVARDISDRPRREGDRGCRNGPRRPAPPPAGAGGRVGFDHRHYQQRAGARRRDAAGQ